MRVLLLTSGGEGGIGGSEVFDMELINRIDKNTFHFMVCCIDKGNLTEMLKDVANGAGCEFFEVKYEKKFRVDIRAILRIRKIIKNRKIEVIHASSGYTAISSILASLFLKLPIIYTHQMPANFSWWTRLFFSFFGRRISRRTAVSRATAQSVEQGGYSFTSQKVDRVIYCGVDLRRFVPVDTGKAKCSLGLQGNVVVGAVGKLIPLKGYSYLIHAIPKIKKVFPDAKLVLAGEGEEENKLRLLANRLGIENDVVFLGNRRDIPDVLSSFDVFVLPSFSEGLPIVILEAFSLCKPVVATNVGGIHEMVINGENGFLVQPKDSNALAERIITLLKDPLLAGRMGKKGRRLVEENFDINNKIREYESLYLEVRDRK
ncbi:MAG: glycosyltransferase family 4 protein [Deltaproteobacteria bacterium]|nr:glycosyltransferase family 4 protein [Deltaproteobacteria bacterium]